jgi:hypothetical protein
VSMIFGLPPAIETQGTNSLGLVSTAWWSRRCQQWGDRDRRITGAVDAATLKAAVVLLAEGRLR